MYVRMKGSERMSWESRWRIFWNRGMSFCWYAVTRFVIAWIWGSFLYLLISHGHENGGDKGECGEREKRGKKGQVRLGFLGGERVDVGFHQHVCKDKIFKDLDSL